jgi:hypothetical protein
MPPGCFDLPSIDLEFEIEPPVKTDAEDILTWSMAEFIPIVSPAPAPGCGLSLRFSPLPGATHI